MNIPISYAIPTNRYISGNTYSNQDYVKDWEVIEIININECKMEEFELITPIPVRLEKDYNDWIASDSITGVYSFGDTREEAKQNFCYALEDVYKFLSEDLNNLTPINKNTYEYLKKILSKK